jgi:hypothetical protein
VAESVVKASVIYDTSQMKEGVAESVEGLQQIAAQATVTSETMKTKSQAMADAAKAAASTITTSDIAIAQATKIATDAKVAQAKALRDVKSGAGDAKDAIVILAAAQREARESSASLAMAQREVATSQEMIASTSHSAVSGIQATSGAVRLFEGNGGIRAVETFVSKTLGLGPALQAVFPIIGGLAFAEVVGKIIGKVDELYDDLLTFKTLAADVSKGVAASGDEIAAAWGKTRETLHAVGTRDNPFGTLKVDIVDAETGLRVLQARAVAMKKDLDALNSVKSSGNFIGNGTNEEENDLDIQGQQSNLEKINAQIGEQKARIADLESQASKVSTKIQTKDASTGNKAAEARLRAMEEERESEEQEGKLGAKADHDYWAARIGEFARGSAEYAAIQKKITADDVEGARAAHEAIAKFKGEQAHQSAGDPAKQDEIAEGMAKVQAAAREQGEDVWRTGERWDGYNKAVAAGQEIATRTQMTLAEGALRIRESAGGVTSLGAAQQLAAIHTKEHTDRLKELEAELAKLKAEGANLKPGDKGYEENATKQQGAQNAITQEQGSGKVQGQQDQAAIAAGMAKPYLSAFDSINDGWMKVQNAIIAGHRNIGRTAVQAAQGMVSSAAAAGEKWLANKARHYIMDVMLHRVAETQKVAATTASATSIAAAQTTAAAAGHVSLAALNVGSATSYAAVAAAGAAASQAFIPFVGPALAVAAGASTFAAVAGTFVPLAAYEQGGVVGGSPGMAVPILAHSGERVLSNSQTNNFERMVNNSNSGGDVHLHMGDNHYHGSSSSDIRAAGAQNDRQTVKTITRLHREGKLKLA